MRCASASFAIGSRHEKIVAIRGVAPGSIPAHSRDSLPPLSRTTNVPRPKKTKTPQNQSQSAPTDPNCAANKASTSQPPSSPEEHSTLCANLNGSALTRRQSRPAIQAALANFLYAKLVEQFAHTPWAIAARQLRLDAVPPPRPPPRRPTCPNCLCNPFRPRKLRKYCSKNAPDKPKAVADTPRIKDLPTAPMPILNPNPKCPIPRPLNPKQFLSPEKAEFGLQDAPPSDLASASAVQSPRSTTACGTNQFQLIDCSNQQVSCEPEPGRNL